MYTIVNMLDYAGGLEPGIKFYHNYWGNDKNFLFFDDAIRNSSNKKTGLPRFYLLLKQTEIVGCIGLVTNDLISRHDLIPWVVGVFVAKSERGKELGNYMMKHVESEAKLAGHSTVFLTTDLDGYYEKYGWTRIENGFESSGKATKIYKKKLN